MIKKIVILLISVLLLSCGTDYFYSSFYLRNTDLNWMLSPSEQDNLNYKTTVIGTGDFRFNSPSIVSTIDNYILFLYERRNNSANTAIIGVDGVNKTEVYAAVSKNAETFSVITQPIGGSTIESYGSPIAFVNKNSDVIVLAVSGNGFGDASVGTSPSIISKSVSVPKTEYKSWSEWEDLNTNIFESLLDKYDRFYTSPDSGITLQNGTLACIIDYKKSSSANAEGFAILYSTDDGTNWQLGAKATYQNHRFAKIIAERKDGKLIVAAVENSNDDYNKKGNLAWFLVDSLKGNITSFSPSGLPTHNCGSTSGGKLKVYANGYSKEGILLLHSYPQRETVNQNAETNTVNNVNALYISFDEGQNWKMVTNIFYPLTESIFNNSTIYFYDRYDNMASFRQSIKILKDGTIASVAENGGYVINTSGQDVGFKIIYRRYSLSAISDGKYRYEGL